MGTIIVGKLAKPLKAADALVSPGAAKPSCWMFEGRLTEAIRASFEPVMDEPLPDRLKDMIEKIRIEEQKKGAR